MDATVTDRIQFAFTIMFHYLFPITTMGLAPILVYFKTLEFRTGQPKYGVAFRFWVRIFAIAFVTGVISGVPMEFQFGTNWAVFSAFAGGIIAQTLAMEGIFAFFLESSFLGIVLFGEKRVSPFFHWLATLLLAAGSWISGFFITATNAWMQHPVGYGMGPNGSVHLTSLWALLTNVFAWWQYFHVISGAVVAGTVLVASIGAYYLLMERHVEFGRLSVTVGVLAGLVFSMLQIFPTGDENARNVLQYQPVKQASYEGLFKSQSDAPLSIIGMPAIQQRKLVDAVEIPGLLSFLAYGDTRRPVTGLEAFPTKDWPPVQITYFAYHIMVGLGTLFLAIMALGALLLWRKRLFEARWFLWVLTLLLPFPYIANEAGWAVTEMGRQPWLVWGLLLTSKGSSPTVIAAQAIFTLLGFVGLYMVIGLIFVFFVGREVFHGPSELKASTAIRRS